MEALQETDRATALAARLGDGYLILLVRAVLEVIKWVGSAGEVADGLVLVAEVLVDQGRDDEAAVERHHAINIRRAVNDDRVDALAARTGV